MTHPRRLQVLPGFGLSLGMSLLFVAIVLLLPLSGLALNLAELSFADYRDLPFALPTAVAGIALATLFAADGWLGQPLAALGIAIAYKPAGIVVAMIFTSIPFVVRAVQPVLEALPPAVEEAAATLGARPPQIFTRVILPQLMPALASGVVLSFARSLGEFGAVIFIAGNQPYVSKVVSLLIFERLQEFDLPAAAAIASLMLAASLLLLLLVNLWQGHFLRRFGRNA